MVTLCCSRSRSSYPELALRVIWSPPEQEAHHLAPEPTAAASSTDPIASCSQKPLPCRRSIAINTENQQSHAIVEAPGVSARRIERLQNKRYKIKNVNMARREFADSKGSLEGFQGSCSRESRSKPPPQANNSDE